MMNLNEKGVYLMISRERPRVKMGIYIDKEGFWPVFNGVDGHASAF
jgi:hypothetical protein